jgi:hypothetical protein
VKLRRSSSPGGIGAEALRDWMRRAVTGRWDPKAFSVSFWDEFGGRFATSLLLSGMPLEEAAWVDGEIAPYLLGSSCCWWVAFGSIVDSFDSVKSAIGVLRASNSFGCELITKCFIEYIEAASWDENEGEEILEVARCLAPEAVSLLARLQAPSADAVKNVFISAIRFATGMETPFPPFLDDLKTSAQEQIDFMIHEDHDTAFITMDDDVRSVVKEGLRKLLSAPRAGLHLLSAEFDQSPDQPEQRILCSLTDIDWIANFLTKIEMMHDFVSG